MHFFFFLLLFPTFLLAEIRKSDDIFDLLEMEYSKESLLLINLEGTLYQSKSFFASKEWLKRELSKKRLRGMSKEEALVELLPLQQEAQLSARIVLKEAAAAAVIDGLASRQVPMLALAEQNLEMACNLFWQLKTVKLDFSKVNSPLDFEELDLPHPSKVVSGVCFYSPLDEQRQLCENLLSQVKPKKLFVVDSSEKKLEGLEVLCREKCIDFLGLLYQPKVGKSRAVRANLK